MASLLPRIYATTGPTIVRALHRQYALAPEAAADVLTTITPVLLHELRTRLRNPEDNTHLLASLQQMLDETAVPDPDPERPAPSKMQVITLLMGPQLAPVARTLASRTGLDKGTAVRATLTTLNYLLEHLKTEVQVHGDLVEVLA